MDLLLWESVGLHSLDEKAAELKNLVNITVVDFYKSAETSFLLAVRDAKAIMSNENAKALSSAPKKILS